MSVLLKTIGYEATWDTWPWKVTKSPIAQYKVLPTFAVIEYTYRAASWACFAHALKTDGMPIWFSAWVCGTFNDCFFMWLPFCDNFWQAQATVMLTPRLPLYIVEMYATIIYLSTVAARQFNLPYVSEGALCGLLAHVLYGVYDINGPPNLWWTWHDGDPAISKRQQNAPLGSSMWILTYIGIHSLLLRWTETPYARLSDDLKTFLARSLTVLPSFCGALADKLRVVQALDLLRSLQSFLNHAKGRYGALAGWAVRILFSGAVCTPLFMQLMGVFQILSLDTVGVPGQRTYRLTLLAYLALVVRGFVKAHRSGALYMTKGHRHVVEANRYLLGLVAAFYGVNAGIALMGDSTKHLSTGCHQAYGKSHVVKDVMGFNREDHLGPEGPKEASKHDFTLASPEEDGKLDPSGEPIVAPKETGPASEWYTVKGRPRKDREGDLRLLFFMTSVGLVSYGTALSNVLAWLPPYLA